MYLLVLFPSCPPRKGLYRFLPGCAPRYNLDPRDFFDRPLNPPLVLPPLVTGPEVWCCPGGLLSGNLGIPAPGGLPSYNSPPRSLGVPTLFRIRSRVLPPFSKSMRSGSSYFLFPLRRVRCPGQIPPPPLPLLLTSPPLPPPPIPSPPSLSPLLLLASLPPPPPPPSPPPHPFSFSLVYSPTRYLSHHAPLTLLPPSLPPPFFFLLPSPPFFLFTFPLFFSPDIPRHTGPPPTLPRGYFPS